MNFVRRDYRYVAAFVTCGSMLLCLAFYWIILDRGFDPFNDGVFLLACLPDQDMISPLSQWYVYCQAIFNQPSIEIVTHRFANLALGLFGGLFIGVSFCRWMSYRYDFRRTDHFILVTLATFANILSAGFGMISYYVLINLALLVNLGCFLNLDVARRRLERLFFYFLASFVVWSAIFVSAPFALANLVMTFTLVGFCMKRHGDPLRTVLAAVVPGAASGVLLFFALNGGIDTWLWEVSDVIDAMEQSSEHQLSYFIGNNHRNIGLSFQWFIGTLAPFALLATAGSRYLGAVAAPLSRPALLVVCIALLLLLNLSILAITDKNYPELIFAILCVSVLVHLHGRDNRAVLNALSPSAILIFTAVAAMFIALYHFLMQTYSSYTGYALLYPAYIASCVLFLVFLRRVSFLKNLTYHRVLLLYLLVGPLTAVFGSSTDLITGAGRYLVPWYILIMYFIYAWSLRAPSTMHKTNAVSGLIVCLSLLSLTQIFYTQGLAVHLPTTILRQTETISPPGRLENLRVNREVAEFYSSVNRLLGPHLEENTSVLNLTRKPSVVYAVGGHAIGHLYYDQRQISERRCEHLLSRIQYTQHTRPLIFMDKKIDAIHPSISDCLDKVGISVERDYRLLKRFGWPYPAGDRSPNKITTVKKDEHEFFYVYIYRGA